jgi:hypothetical protein
MTAARPASAPRTLASAAELLVLRAAGQLEGIDRPEALALRLPNEAVVRRLQGAEGRMWRRLVDLFAVASAEADLLALAVAVAAEPALGPRVGRAQGQPHRFLPTEPLVKRLHGHPARPIWRPTSPLAVWRLVQPVRHEPGEPLAFEADPRVVDWLFGTLSLDALLVPAMQPLPREPVPAEWPVAETAARVDRTLSAGQVIRLVIEGRPGTGRTRFAAAVADALGRSALVIDPAALEGEVWTEAFVRAQRFALAADMALVWRPGERPWPPTVPLAPLQFVGVEPGRPAPLHAASADLRVELAEAGTAAKARLWAGWAPHLAGVATSLAATPGATLADLAETARTVPADAEEARDQLRARGRLRLAGAGEVLDPAFAWDDLVVPAATLVQLQRIAFEARLRPTLHEGETASWLFRDRTGLAVLFSGPPGVGKSMAVQVIARDLGINLLRIDLAATTSKWIGETAKNLSAAFDAARRAGAALLFEEADALFAKRGEVKDANDRYANADTNHLLHLMEVSGVRAFLTSNRRANIDPAFLRRLDHVVEFERPGPAERRRLWALLLAALGVDEAPLRDALDRLAETLDLSPAQIKAAALGGWFTARQAGRAVRADDLEAAAAHELAKEGRTPPPGERPRRRPGVSHG